LERDRREMLARRDRGEIRLGPAGCRTEKQEQAYQNALQSLEMLREIVSRDNESTSQDKEQTGKEEMEHT